MNKIIKDDIEKICKEALDWNYFSNKNILITGANGILPSYIVETLLMLLYIKAITNTKIIALCRNRKKAESRFNDYLENKNLVFIYQDVCDKLEITEPIDIIIHAASQASPKYYNIDPIGTIAPNVIGTINLLKFAKNNNIKQFIYFSSAEVYGLIKDDKPINEFNFGHIDPMDIRSCYSESKRIGETICYSWYIQNHIPVKIIRPFHTYGPGMALNDGRVFADFVANILEGKDLVINSDGTAKRAFCYISDAILAYFHIILNGKFGNAFNVGNPNEEYSIKDLAEELVKLFPQKKLKVKLNLQNKSNHSTPSSINKVLPDISKTMSLGWTPKINIRDGFYRTIISFDNN